MVLHYIKLDFCLGFYGSAFVKSLRRMVEVLGSQFNVQTPRLFFENRGYKRMSVFHNLPTDNVLKFDADGLKIFLWINMRTSLFLQLFSFLRTSFNCSKHKRQTQNVKNISHKNSLMIFLMIYVLLSESFFEILFGSVRIYLSKLRQPWELWYWTADHPSLYE